MKASWFDLTVNLMLKIAKEEEEGFLQPNILFVTDNDLMNFFTHRIVSVR